MWYIKSRCNGNTPKFYRLHLHDVTKMANFVWHKAYEIEQTTIRGKIKAPSLLILDANHLLTQSTTSARPGTNILCRTRGILCVK